MCSLNVKTYPQTSGSSSSPPATRGWRCVSPQTWHWGTWRCESPYRPPGERPSHCRLLPPPLKHVTSAGGEKTDASKHREPLAAGDRGANAKRKYHFLSASLLNPDPPRYSFTLFWLFCLGYSLFHETIQLITCTWLVYDLWLIKPISFCYKIASGYSYLYKTSVNWQMCGSERSHSHWLRLMLYQLGELCLHWPHIVWRS